MGGKQVQKLRGTVSTARVDSEETPEADAMRNLAYVVSSANDNIQALQRTVKLQEKELNEKSDQCAALQRNYETLARIRQADQNEFMQLKALQAEEHGLIARLQSELVQTRQQNATLEQKLTNTEAAQVQIVELQKQLEEVTRARDALTGELEQAQKSNTELTETNRGLTANIDKLSRAQHEMLQRSRKADEALRVLEGEKEAAERSQGASAAKVITQEKQLKTFLEANEALEADLRKQMQRVAQLERRKQEQEAEQSTIEAYYQARLDEMQAQYDRLLAEIDDSKRQAQKEVYRTFDDDAKVVPPNGAVSPGGRRPAPAKG